MVALVLHVLYYLAGVASAFAWALWTASKAKPKAVPKRWSKVTSIQWEFDFPFQFEHAITFASLGSAMGTAMAREMLKGSLPDTFIDAGSYTVRIRTFAAFTKREEQPCDE